ncbi:MAG: ABC transporter permease [Ferrovibrionaceae bacterium]
MTAALRLGAGLWLAALAAGLAGTLLPAFGYLPALGADGFGLAAWRRLLGWPGIGHSVAVSLTSGLIGTAGAFIAVTLFCAAMQGHRWFDRAAAGLGPLLGLPHAAFGLGFALLVGPSGWLVRLVSPWATGWTAPPDLALVGDGWGLTLAAALAIKEAPYLLLMVVAALPQIRAQEHLQAARSLGYQPVRGWFLVVLPQLYPLIRLPIYAALAFAVSTTDLAIILGPSQPAALGVVVLRLAFDHDATLLLPAAAGACLQGLVALVAIVLWRLGERAVARLGIVILRRGMRGTPAGEMAGRAGGALALLVVGGGSLATIGLLALWSIAGTWRFPDALPDALSTRPWREALPVLTAPLLTAAGIGLAAAMLALAVALAMLERPWRGSRALLYLPLLLPQVTVLFGLQVVLVRSGLDGHVGTVVAVHLLFVLPYVHLSLADAHARFDRRYLDVAAGLGLSPARAFWRIKLPMLARPIAAALAVGFAVSVAQYLPTLFAGAGRVATVTTEAVALSAGGERRLTAAYGFAQGALPALGFLLALLVPRLMSWRR